MLQKILRTTFTILAASGLLIACAHGPKVAVLYSYPQTSNFAGYDERQKKDVTISYANSTGLIAYPEQVAHDLFNYASTENDKPVHFNQVTVCVSNYLDNGLDCRLEVCAVLVPEGEKCVEPAQPVHTIVPYSASLNYVGLSATDNETLLAFINVSIQ